MSIEEEIKQKKFQSEHHKAVVNILFTANWINTLNTKLFKPYGISPEQFNVLRILRGQHPNPASVTLIQDRMLDKMSNASRLVQKLLQKGLVKRKESKVDRRQVDVVITSEGLNLLKKLDLEMKKQEKIFKNITIEEARTLNGLLDKIRK